MPILGVGWPAHGEERHDDVSVVFRTHANYLRAFAVLAGGPITQRPSEIYPTLMDRIQSSGCLPSKQTTGDVKQVQKSLHHAWATELVMAMTAKMSDEDELVRLANNWLAVQSYYVVYHATQAVAVAAGHPRPEQHPKTQQLFATHWASRRVDLAPWGVGVDASGPRNVPVTVDFAIQPLRSFDSGNVWSLACKALATTHKLMVHQRLANARIEKGANRRRMWDTDETARRRDGKRARRRPTFPSLNLTPSEREGVARGTRMATLIDYLYRLRLRTNYGDTSMFTDGPREESESKDVRRCFRILAGTTLLLCEMSLMRRVGKGIVLKWADDWQKSNVPATFPAGLVIRMPFLAGCECL